MSIGSVVILNSPVSSVAFGREDRTLRQRRTLFERRILPSPPPCIVAGSGQTSGSTRNVDGAGRRETGGPAPRTSPDLREPSFRCPRTLARALFGMLARRWSAEVCALGLSGASSLGCVCRSRTKLRRSSGRLVPPWRMCSKRRSST